MDDEDVEWILDYRPSAVVVIHPAWIWRSGLADLVDHVSSWGRVIYCRRGKSGQSWLIAERPRSTRPHLT